MSTSADAVMARFPGPLTFYPSRRKWLLTMSGSALFAAGGVWMLREGNWKGWLVLLFFGLGAAVSAIALLPGAGSLVLDREGFQFSSLFRRHRTLWRDASGFTAATVPPARFPLVVFDDRQQRRGTLASLNVGLVGRTSALPDTYGFKADELAQIMAQWHARATADSRKA
jgi:hypothetical protein